MQREVPMNKFVLIALTAAIAGCAVGPDYKEPKTELPPAFSADDAAYANTSPVAQFWTVFDDAALTELIARSLNFNHDLRIALANINQARALRRESQFDQFPTVTAQAAHQKTRISADESITGRALTSTVDSGGFDAVWELDLFGRVRRNVEANRAAEQATIEDFRAAQISVAAEVARTYFELRGAQEQYAVAQRNADNQTETLKIAQVRLDAGRGTEFDTARSQSLLNTTLAILPQLNATIENSIHRLSVLIGQQPAALRDALLPRVALPELPRLVQIGKPDELLRRRPDVGAAERRLASATASIGVAEGDWFPRVSFTGEIGFAANGLDRIGEGSTQTYSYGPTISWAAFDLGRVQARVNQAKAREQGAVAAYEQTVLRALEETENALTSYRETRHQLDFLYASASASEHASDLARKRFDGGAADFLDVLDSERSQLEVEANLSRARTTAATNLVALYKALGGGWDTVQPTASTQ
jgi:multidrug efflux system outer membrane protein